MKTRFLALAALVLGLASCQNDFEGERVNGSAEVDFQLSVGAPELVGTRAGENGAADTQAAYDSALGAIDYLQAGGLNNDDYRVDWKEVDLRYSLEVYDKADDYTDAEPVKKRMVQIVDEYQQVTFDLRLVPGREYHFVVFADFVEQGADDDSAIDTQRELGLRHNIGETLADITVKDEEKNGKFDEFINDEISDAYFAVRDITVSNSKPEPIFLERPYGKIRVIATDLAELNLNVEPAKVVVKYEAAHAAAFNAVTGEIDTTEVTATEYTTTFNDGVCKESLENHFYTAGYDAEKVTDADDFVRHSHITLFTDYILAEADQNAIHFEISAYEKDGSLIKTTNFDTDIPVQRNYLTTVIGNVLTTATHIEVTIDDNFAGNHKYQLWDGEAIAEPKKVDGVYEIYEASELAWLAAQVNGGTRAAGISFKGETFRLMKDIHLNGERWTAIGTTDCSFSGTFDGNNHKIEGLFAYETGKVSAGLFGYCPSATIKNLTVLNAEVYGNYKAAVIVADAVCTKIENCHVDGAIVLSTPYEKNDANNVGAIAGYLSAEPTAYVKGCTVNNATITAYRKVGGVVGAANGAAEVSGNTVKGTAVTADMTAEYKEVKPADVGAVVGWAHADAIVKDNTPVSGPNVANQNAVLVFVKVKDGNDINNNSDFAVVIPEGEYIFTEDVKSQSIQVREGEVEITAGNIETGHPNQYGFVAEGENTSLVINDANINSLGGGIGASDGAQVTFKNGELAVNSTSTSGRYLFYVVGEGTVVTIDGGEFSFSSTLNQKRAYVYTGTGAKVIINGGKFGKASTRSGYTDGILGTGETIIYGGTFGFNPTRWVAEGCTVKKDGANWVVMKPEVATAEEFAARLQDDIKEINVVLTENLDVAITSLGSQTPGSGEYKLGGESTEKITIDLNGKTLNITTTYWSNLGAKNPNALFTIKNGTMTSSQATGTWNSYDLTFSNCDYVFENVKFAKAVAFDNAGKKVTMKDVTINETHDYYAMWITAAGQNVTIDGLTINSDGRGIKIDEQYVNDAVAKVTLNVKNATFNTVNKSAIIVKSVAGADIALENVDIANVAADPAFAVWVDEDAASYADLVTVTGGLKKVEGATAALGTETITAGTYKFPAAENFTAETVLNCEEGTVFEGNSKLNINGATIIGATFSNPGGTAVDQTINGTFKNCTFTGTNGLRWAVAGETVVFENCVFDGSVYGAHFDSGANDVVFKNCVFSGFNAFGGAITLLTLDGCTFKAGRSAYNGANLWGSTEMKDCKFIFDGSVSYEWIDCISTSGTYSFDNCEINGVAYTADNYTSYLNYIESRNDITAKINGVDCAM